MQGHSVSLLILASYLNFLCDTGLLCQGDIIRLAAKKKRIYSVVKDILTY